MSLFLLVISLEVGFAQTDDEWRYPNLISESIATYCVEPDRQPSIVDAEVICGVVLDRDTGIYSYSYVLRNSEKSTGCIKRFTLDIRYPQESQTLSSAGLIDYPKHVSKEGIVDDPEAVPVVPVAFPSLPNMRNTTAWIGGLSIEGKASWGARHRMFLLDIGNEIQGFALTSHGLPAIRAFELEPDYVAKDADLHELGATKEEIIQNSWEWLHRFYDSIAFKGKTIGPTAPPLELVPLDFLENIISMKHEAVSLGWITNKGIETGLDQKLEAVKNKLRQGNSGAAGNILKAFIQEVDAQGCESYDDCPKGKPLTPEAYALLKYNAQYLVDNMK